MQREDVEALMSYLRGEKEDEAADLVAALLDRAERAEAERDAAFAAGQEEMRERMCLRLALWAPRRVIEAIRALPIKPRPT